MYTQSDDTKWWHKAITQRDNTNWWQNEMTQSEKIDWWHKLMDYIDDTSNHLKWWKK